MITDFKTKVQSMTAKEMIIAMVDGLRKPACKINMLSNGHYSEEVCFGCAATNTVAKILEIDKLKPEDIRMFWNDDYIPDFEVAIDCLRRGSIYSYNYEARRLGLAEINDYTILPFLYYDYTEADLLEYENFAKTL